MAQDNKEAYEYADSELKKIKVNGFEYLGDRGSGDSIFAFEKIVNDEDSYCIVLNGSQNNGNVEIEAETDYNSGGNEYIDKIVSFGSWMEAIEHLKKNTSKIIREVEEQYEKHKKLNAKAVTKAFILEQEQ